MKQVIQLMTILFISMSMSCKKKNQTPTEYFSFDADGVHYDYPQIKGATIGVGNWKTLGAGTSGSTAYKIYTYNKKEPVA